MLAYWQNERSAFAGLKSLLHRLALLICLSALPIALLGHSDLLLQIKTLDAQIEAGPASAEMYLKRGDLYRRHEDLAMAASDFAAARKANPDNLLLDFYDGRLFLESGDPAGAETHLARYLSANAQHGKAWVLRGQANIRLSQTASAADFFAKAIEQSATPSPELFRLQILSTLAIDESHWSAALQIADNGVRHFGAEVMLLGLAIDISLAQNLPQNADGYLNMLPSSLHRLPQWAERLEFRDCFLDNTAEDKTDCLSQARSKLIGQIEYFLANT